MEMEVMDLIYVAILITFISSWLLFLVIMFVFIKEKPIDRLKFYDEDYAIIEKHENNKKEKLRILKTISKFVPHLKFYSKREKILSDMLIKADIPITVEELLIIKLFFSVGISFLLYIISKDLIVMVGIFLLTWNIPNLFINNKKVERIKKFDEQLDEGIMIISNSLKAGYSFMQAIAVVVEETRDPFSKEFKKLLKEMSLGISEEVALKNIVSRMESENLKLIINAILIQKDVGGKLSEILDNISDTIRERQKLKSELKTLTAQGKLSGLIVMLIPFFLGIIIYIFNKEYIMLLFTTTIGIALIISAIVNQILGLLIIKKIINIDM